MKIAASWYPVLKEELEKPYIQNLKTFLEEEKKEGQVIFPPESQIFNAFLQTPFDQVKVVLMGQDPYHGQGQAHGLCFSVPEGVRFPPSLRNIFLELKKDVGVEKRSSDLSSWARQGVLLLNAILTVREGAAASHHKRGWEQFTDAVIRVLSEKKEPIVFLLWGRYAQEKCVHFAARQDRPHLILKAAHPSPLSAHNGFLGCGHFSKTNAFLKEKGMTPIDWGF